MHTLTEAMSSTAYGMVAILPTFLLAALGMLVILGLMNIINLAHTGFMAIGAYAALASLQAGSGYLVATAVAIFATAAIATVIEWTVIRRLYGRHIDDSILATWGIFLIILEGLTILFGRSNQTLKPPVEGNALFLEHPYSHYQLMLLCIVLLLYVGVGALIRFTKSGLLVRLVLDNQDLARVLGVNTARVRKLTFIGGASLAGLSGVLLAPTQGVTPSFGSTLLAPIILMVMMAGRSLAGTAVACSASAVVYVLVDIFGNSGFAHVALIGTAVFVLRIWPEGFSWLRI